MRTPCYRMGEVIRPGDTFTIDGTRDRPWTVERVEYSLYGWTIWDTDGNDRPPDDLVLKDRPGKITVTMEFDFTTILGQLEHILAGVTGFADSEEMARAHVAASAVAGKIRSAVDAELKRKDADR